MVHLFPFAWENHGKMLFFSKRNPKNRDILDFACQITLLEVSGVESAKIALFVLSAIKRGASLSPSIHKNALLHGREGFETRSIHEKATFYG